MNTATLTIGTPLDYQVTNLKRNGVAIAPNVYTWYATVKDALTLADGSAIRDISSLSHPLQFVLTTTQADVRCLTPAESAALESSITAFTKTGRFVDDQLIVGEIFMTIIAKTATVGPFLVEHKKLLVVRSANLVIT